MKILIIGKSGQVGWELQRELACLGGIIAVDRHSVPYAIDLTDNDSISRTVAALKPDLIINAAAHTAVDKAEQEVALVNQINGYSLAVLAEAAKKCHATLVHYSTDYVFNGSAATPYPETHPTDPQSAYGASKLLGEQAIIESGVDFVIFRTAWVYGIRGHNFLRTMLRLMAERDTLNIVADQIGSPTWSRQIALATALILAKSMQNDRINLEDNAGIYHLTSSGQTSWFGFAEEIYQQSRQLGILQHPVTLKAITTADYPTPAKRPAYSVLAGDKLYTRFGIKLPAWQQALALSLAEYPGA